MTTIKDCIRIIESARNKGAHSFSMESGVSCFFGTNKQATILILRVSGVDCDTLLDVFGFISDDRF